PSPVSRASGMRVSAPLNRRSGFGEIGGTGWSHSRRWKSRPPEKRREGGSRHTGSRTFERSGGARAAAQRGRTGKNRSRPENIHARGGRRVSMRAMLLKAQRTPLVEIEVPRPSPALGQILLRVHACGVCRTDLHVVDGELSSPKLPLIVGHEVV